ncbi:MAG: hypothetical protein ACPHEP_04390 [Acidimicrobiales bacterium]
MATVVEDVLEVATLVEREPRSVWGFAPTTDTAEMVDGVTLVAVSALREVGELNDSTEDKTTPIVTESVQVSDTVTPVVQAVRTVSETATAQDRVVGGARIAHTERDIAELNDSSTGAARISLRDVATLSDTTSPTQVMRRTLREVGELNDNIYWPLQVTASESAELNDSVEFAVRATHIEREVGTLNDSILETANNVISVRDTAELNDSTAVTLTTIAVLREVAYPSDIATPPTYGRAYTASVANWAMSTFSNFPFSTMAGNLAAGENLWRLDAADDYGTDITSTIKTGVIDFGSSRTKRLSALYVAGESNAPMDLSVTADVDGSQETYEYSLELRDQDNYRNNRALIGKGFRGRYAQFALSATAVDFKVLSAEADTATSHRRL